MYSDHSPKREQPAWLRLLLTLLPLATLRGAEVIGRFGCFALAAWLLSAASLATFFLMLAWLALGASLARVGLDRAATRHVAAALSNDDPGLAAAVARQALLLSVIGGLAVGAASLVAVPLAARWQGYPGLDGALLACGLVLPVFTVSQVVGGILVGMRKPGLGQAVQSSLWPLAVIAALLLGVRTAQGLLAVIGVTQAATSAAGMWVAGLPFALGASPQAPLEAPLEASLRSASLLRDGLPIMALDLVGVGIVNLPLLALGQVAGAEAVAGFGLAQRLFMLPWTLIMTIAALMAARFAAAAAADDLPALDHASRQAMLLARLTALPASLLLLAFPGFWLGLFGPDFRIAAEALMWLAAAQALHAGWAVQDSVLAMAGLNRVLRRIVLTQGAMILAGSVLLVPGWGMRGAAWAVAGPLLFGAWACRRAVLRHLRSGRGPRDAQPRKARAEAASSAAPSGPVDPASRP